MKAAARQSPDCIKKTKKCNIKKTNFQYGGCNYDTLQCGKIMTLISPGDCTCNVACGSGIMTVNSPSGSTLQCDTWLWDDMPLNSSGGITLQCNTLGSRHWIRQVTTPCNVAGGLGMTCHGIRPNVCHIGILHLVSIFTISPYSTCHSAPVCKILSKSDHPQQKKMTLCRFSTWQISAILDFMGPIMVSLKSPCTTAYRSLIVTIALNCLVLRK